MAVCASQVFDFLNRHQRCAVERHEISLSAFSTLRRSLRFVVLRLREGDDPEAREISDRLRTLLSEWLTVPIPFDTAILGSIQANLGGPKATGARWGRDIRVAYEQARKAAQTLSHTDNPLRADLQTAIRQLKQQGRTFRFYCHRRARPHFESLSAEPLDEGAFLHSVADYRQAEPFDVLIKVGPLRSRGWGSAPDALLTAPRFATLVQIVWSGCGDEPDFGYDPVSGESDSEPTTKSGIERKDRGHGISWTHRITSVGDDLAALPDNCPDIDELQIFGQFSRGVDSRRATLVQIDEAHGILYPPLSHVLSFDAGPGVNNPIARRLPGDTLLEGMFVILPLLADVDIGGLHAKDGQFSNVWKARLRDELRLNLDGICLRLQNRGVRLLHLRSCVEYWSMPPRTVIHAPQRARDFEILIDILGLDFAPDQKPKPQAHWWRYAWEEICRTRGVAIQTGQQRSELIDEELLGVLNILLPEIYSEAKIKDAFSFPIPAERLVRGSLRFSKVSLVEEGFIVPDSALKMISELPAIEQWRA
jgi:hypothetical protein